MYDYCDINTLNRMSEMLLLNGVSSSLQCHSQGKLSFGQILNHILNLATSLAPTSTCVCGGDVLTRCMVEVAPPPIGGLAARRSHWSRESVVAAVCQERQ